MTLTSKQLTVERVHLQPFSVSESNDAGMGRPNTTIDTIPICKSARYETKLNVPGKINGHFMMHLMHLQLQM